MSLQTICPKFCTREYAPVCAMMGSELKEFSNKCVLDSWNCESEESKLIGFQQFLKDVKNFSYLIKLGI